MVKKFLMVATILLCGLAGVLLAQAPVLSLEVSRVAGDGWAGIRYQMAPEQLWPLTGAAWLRVSWNEQPINPDDPGAKFAYYIPATGQRYYVIPQPAVERNDWHNVVEVLDGAGNPLARTEDFVINLEAGPPRFSYVAPAMSVGYGFTCAIQIVNYNDSPVTPELEFWSFDEGLVDVWLPAEPVPAGGGISKYVQELIPGPFNGWVRVTSPHPLSVTGLTGISLDAGWVMLPAVRQ